MQIAPGIHSVGQEEGGTDFRLRSLSSVNPGHPAANSGHVAITSPAKIARRSGHQKERQPGV